MPKSASELALRYQMLMREGGSRDKSGLAIDRVGDVLGLLSCKCTNRVEFWCIGRNC